MMYFSPDPLKRVETYKHLCVYMCLRIRKGKAEYFAVTV